VQGISFDSLPVTLFTAASSSSVPLLSLTTVDGRGEISGSLLQQQVKPTKVRATLATIPTAEEADRNSECAVGISVSA
jgi:hypothetical protein